MHKSGKLSVERFLLTKQEVGAIRELNWEENVKKGQQTKMYK